MKKPGFFKGRWIQPPKGYVHPEGAPKGVYVHPKDVEAAKEYYKKKSNTSSTYNNVSNTEVNPNNHTSNHTTTASDSADITSNSITTVSTNDSTTSGIIPIKLDTTQPVYSRVTESISTKTSSIASHVESIGKDTIVDIIEAYNNSGGGSIG